MRTALAPFLTILFLLPALPASADPQETAAWRMAVRLNGVEDYRSFLSSFPSGKFAAFARNRVAAAGGAGGGTVATAPLSTPSGIDAAAAEASMALGGAARDAARDGLIARGLAPGEAAGPFGVETRAAIRAWQASLGLAPTGYLTEPLYDELTAAPLSGAIPKGAAMTHRLDPGDPADRRAREESLGYGPEELAEIESRLARAGFAPGPEDGVLDEAARGAISAYRLSRGLQAHGWLDRPMIDRLMRDTAFWRGPVAARP